jgi:hypothetical protein
VTATTATPQALSPAPAAASAAVVPRIAGCDDRARAELASAYRVALGWVRRAAEWLRGLARRGDASRTWHASPLARLFGPFSPQRLRRVVRVVRGLLDRFTHGFTVDGGRLRPTLACLPPSYERCQTGLLGNASIYGTLRFCPRLLTQAVPAVAKVVLHEMMHQGLGVGDRRHADCEGSKHRCYRDGAATLVAAGRYDLAGRNIDNYVAFIRHVATGATAGVP